MTKWLEIDLEAIAKNIALIKKEIAWPKVKLMVIVKANAYGHGLVEVAKRAVKEKIDYFGVATVSEALELRKNHLKTPILVIGPVAEEEIREAIKHRVSLSLYNIEILKKIETCTQKLKSPVLVHLKIDTGMHRLGFPPEDLYQTLPEIICNPYIKIEYLYSHFAEVKNKNYAQKQLKILSDFLDKIGTFNIPVHFSRSLTLKQKETHFEMFRTGLAIYGLEDFPGFKPALSFKTRIAQIKNLKKGDYVGYGLTFKANQPMKIAILGVGYADGLDRKFSNCGEILVAGIRCPIIGRVCMNMTMINVRRVRNCKVGDEAVLIGKSGREEITASDLAQNIDTIAYEIVSRIPTEIPRIY